MCSYIFCISLKISSMSFLKDLFTELCKRGCIIETKSRNPIDHLPKCLANYYPESDRNFSAEFKISSIIPSSVHMDFKRWVDNQKRIHYRSIVIPICRCGRGVYELIDSKDHYIENMKLLDNITDYLYTGNHYNLYYLNKIDKNTLACYKENLKTKMIKNLNKGIFEFVCSVDGIFPKELKLLIINMILKLNNWHNLGII